MTEFRRFVAFASCLNRRVQERNHSDHIKPPRTEWFYAGRAVGRHCDHRDTCSACSCRQFRRPARQLAESQCKNNLKQIGVAVLNLESTQKIFPTGGDAPWPLVEWFSNGTKANGPRRQGLSWAFQVLPYLEEGAVYDIASTEKIAQSPITLYYCPSRRPPTRGDSGLVADGLCGSDDGQQTVSANLSR